MKSRILAVVALAAMANGATGEEPQGHEQSGMADCPMKQTHAGGMDERGEKGMGFSQTKTTHHFRITSNGGAIEVTANDATDLTSREQIRTHLTQIAELFAAGKFEIPMLVHDGMPDGAKVMQQLKSKVTYNYEDTDNGGRVRIMTNDPQALSAVHAFMRFQIREHRTGDAMEVAR